MKLKFIYNLIYNNIFILSGVLFPVITFPYVTRVLGPEAFGLVNLALSISTIFIMIMQIGIPVYGIKAMAKSILIDDKRKVFWSLIIINIVTGVISSLLYLIFIYCFDYLSSEPILFLLILPSILLGFTSVDWYFASKEDFKSIAIRTLILRVLSLVLLLVCVNNNDDYNIYASIIIFGNLLANLIMFYLASKEMSLPGVKVSFLDIKIHLIPLKFLFLASIVASFYGSLDILVIDYFWGVESVGFYSLDRRLTLILIALIGSFSTVLIPRMTKYRGNGDDENFNFLFKNSLNFLYVLNFPIVASLIVFSDEFVQVFAGSDYHGAVMALKVLSLQVLFNSGSNLLNVQVLMPLGKEREIFKTSAIGLGVSIIFCIILIPTFNIVGAAIALVVSEFIIFSLRYRCAQKICGVNFFDRQFSYITVSGICLFSVYQLVHNLFIYSQVDFIVKIGLAIFFIMSLSLLYFIFLYKLLYKKTHLKVFSF